MVLLVGIHPMCLLVANMSLESLQCAIMCLLITKAYSMSACYKSVP